MIERWCMPGTTRRSDRYAAEFAADQTVDRIFDPVEIDVYAALRICNESDCHTLERMADQLEAKRHLLRVLLRGETAFAADEAEHLAASIQRTAARLRRRAERIMRRERRTTVWRELVSWENRDDRKR